MKPLTATKIIFIIFLCSLLGPHPLQAETFSARFEPVACPFALPPGETIRCGYLIVPEQHRQPEGLKIRVGVTIVKSHSARPEADPLIYINGGPGGLTEDLIEGLSQFDGWLAKRDLILFDQRGVGWSQPALDCPDSQEVELQQLLGVELSPAVRLAPVLACLERWKQQGLEPAAYNSTETAADIAALGQALGYKQVNLFGVSYGTIPAQLVMRDYGAKSGQIRSVILDSPIPLAVKATAETPARVAEAMARLFEACRTDWLCRTAYPELETVYYRLLERLSREPVPLTAINPLDGRPFNFSFKAADLGGLLMYSAPRILPGLIYDLDEEHYQAIIRGHEETFLKVQQGQGSAFGLRTTVACSEPWYEVSAADRAAMQGYPEVVLFEAPFSRPDLDLCAAWPRFTQTDRAPARVGIPTLVLTAEHDSRLPAAYGEFIVKELRRGYHLHVPGAGHNVLGSGGPCPNLIALAFIDEPDQTPEAGCLAASSGPAFDTRFLIRGAAVRAPLQGLMAVMGLLVVGAGFSAARYRRAGLGLGFAWRASLRLAGWLGPLAGVALMALGWATLFSPVATLGLVIPLITAIQAAFLFSPEDEPALEIILAMPRPPAWTLLERLAALWVSQGGTAFLLSLLLALLSGESLGLLLSRWVAPLLCLCGLSIYLSLATRRAIFGILITGLLWVVITVFGDFILERWPVFWPFHLYLPSDQPDYLLNRLFLSLLGLSLIGLAIIRLLPDEERLLLGKRPGRRSARKTVLTPEPEGGQSLLWLPTLQLNQVRQLAAMIQYEFLLQWRRATLPALWVGLMMTPLLGVWIARPQFEGYSEALAAGILAPEVAAARITAAMIPVIWMGIILIGLLMVPPLVADTISRDRQVGVNELLESLPFSPGVYLAGKLLSLWLNLLLCLGLAALLAGLAWWFLVGPFNLALFTELWVVGAAGLLLINAGTSLLLAAGQPNSRRAILLGVAYTFLCLVGLGFSFSLDHEAWRWFNPARPALLLYYILGFPGATARSDEFGQALLAFVQQVAGRETVLASLAAGFLQVGLLWLMGWQVLKRRWGQR